MFRTRIFILFAALALFIAFTGCGDEGTTTPGSDEVDQTEASEPEETEDTDEAEEEVSACLGKKKGPVTKVVAGKLAESFGAAVRFYPPKLKLPAGKVVTLNIVHGGGPAHTFTLDPFYCQPHQSAGMDGEIIGVK